MTGIPVADGKMTNEQLGQFTRRTDDIKRRVNEGTITYDWVMDELQRITEGRQAIISPAETPALPESAPAPFQFKFWKKITLGLHKTPEEYRQALQVGGFRVGTYADQILEKITVSEAEIEVDLALVTPREVGFDRNVRYEDFCKRIVKLGAELCPDEVGPATRLQYQDQPKGEWFRVAMKALTDSDGSLSVFDVVRGDDGRWLSLNRGDADALYNPDDQFVVVVPRKL